METVQRGLKRRTICQVIEKKLQDWYKSIKDRELAAVLPEHVIVTGGCIASMLLGESVKDYDIYLDSYPITERLANYYVAQFNAERSTSNNVRTSTPYVRHYQELAEERIGIFVRSAGVASETDGGAESYRYFEGQPADSVGADEYVDNLVEALQEQHAETKVNKYHPVFLSQNAISLSDKIQVVIRFIGQPDEIHKNYDYVHATNYYYQGKLTLRPQALESLLSKALIYQGSLYPVCSLFRMRKFMDRGWRISAGEIVKMAMQISELDLHDPKVLQAQLIGVDAAYFYELLRILNHGKEEGRTIDSSYVMQIIDQLAYQDHV
jgi:hypothetical protein